MDNINLIMHHIVTVNIKTTTNRKTKKEAGWEMKWVSPNCKRKCECGFCIVRGVVVILLWFGGGDRV